MEGGAELETVKGVCGYEDPTVPGTEWHEKSNRRVSEMNFHGGQLNSGVLSTI